MRPHGFLVLLQVIKPAVIIGVISLHAIDMSSHDLVPFRAKIVSNNILCECLGFVDGSLADRYSYIGIVFSIF